MEHGVVGAALQCEAAADDCWYGVLRGQRCCYVEGAVVVVGDIMIHGGWCSCCVVRVIVAHYLVMASRWGWSCEACGGSCLERGMYGSVFDAGVACAVA